MRCLPFILLLLSMPAHATEIGKVSTRWHLLTPSDKLVVEVFDDPKIDGVSCYVTLPEKGGVKSTLGLAEDVSDVSIACRQTGPVTFREPFEQGEPVFRESRSLVFKRLRVVRYWDDQRNTLVYLSYSDRPIEGSPKNSTSAVTAMPWGDQVPGKPVIKD